MKYFQWVGLIIVGLGLLMGPIGCSVKKQVRYSSGPPNVAISTQVLHQASETHANQVTYSHDTRYVQVNGAE